MTKNIARFISKGRWPSKKTVVITVALLVAVGVGVCLLVWTAFYRSAEQPAGLPPDPERQQYLERSQTIQAPTDASTGDQVGYLSIEASSAFELGNYDIAIDRYQQILALPGQANNADALYNLGRSYQAQGDKGSAKQVYQRLLQAYRDVYGVAPSSPTYQDLQQRIEQL